MKGTAGLFTIQ